MPLKIRTARVATHFGDLLLHQAGCIRCIERTNRFTISRRK